MKISLLILSLMALVLNGCVVAPYGESGDGYRRERDHREDNHGGERGDRDRERERDRYR